MLRPAVVVSALVLVVAGCGGGDEPDRLAAGDDFSIEAALAELPVPPAGEDGATVSVTVADLTATAEANGAERPADGADGSEAGRWFAEASGSAPPGGDPLPVYVAPFDALGLGRGGAEDLPAELGWSVLDVEAAAEVHAPPFQLGVVAGDVDEETLEDADLTDLDDGVFSAGEGEDGEPDTEATSSVRPLGAPVRMAAVDGRLVASSSTEAVAAWRDGEPETLAEDDDLRGLAAALDEAGAISAHLVMGDFGPKGEDPPPGATDAVVIEEPFTAAGIGWGVDDGDTAVTAVYAFADDAAAETAADQVEAAYRDARSLQTHAPIGDVLELVEVEVDGAIVTAHLRIVDGPPSLIDRMLTSGDQPFTHR